MIRRGFWLTAGAVTGIYGYRRVSAVGRRISASLNHRASLNPEASRHPNPGASPYLARSSASLTQGARLARRGGRGVIRLARESYRFTRDVREGMDLYLARHSEPPGSTLSTDHDETDHDEQPEDGH